jgi:hypothetical protein
LSSRTCGSGPKGQETKMKNTHEIRQYLEGCEGSGKIVHTGNYRECANAKRRMEHNSSECYTFSIFRIDGTPDGTQFTRDQDGRKVIQPGF